MVEEIYDGLPSKTRTALNKFEERIGVRELNSEFTDQLTGYSETLMRLLGGIILASVIVLFLAGAYIILNRASMLSGPMLFPWNLPMIDYAESLYCWAANSMLLFSSLILVRCCFYAIYKSHGKGLWFTVLWMAVTPFLFMLLVGIYTGNATCIRLLGSMLGLFGLSQLLVDANVPIFGFFCIALVALSFYLCFMFYLRVVKKYGYLPVPKYSFQVKSRGTAPNFNIGTSTVCGAGMLAYAALGILSLVSLAMHGVLGAYNTNTFTALWMVYPLMAMGQHFGDLGIIVGIAIPFAYLFAMPFVDRNLFTSWRRRKPLVALGVIIMAVYAALGFMANTPNSGTTAVSGGLAFAPAFTYPEFHVIVLPIAICCVLGIYLLMRKTAE